MITLDLLGYFCSSINMKSYLCLSILSHLLRINFPPKLKCLGQIMVLNIPTLPFMPFALPMAFCIKPLAYILLHRMVFPKGSIGILLKQVLLFSTGLIYPIITSLMLLPLLFFLLTDYLLLS